MKLDAPIPVLRMFDEKMTREFYVDFLGFRIDWEHRVAERAPLYMQVSLGRCVLQLSAHFGDASPGGALRILIDDIDAYQQTLLARQYRHALPGTPQPPPWGSQPLPWESLELTVTDPSGNKLIFMQDIRPAGTDWFDAA